MLLGILSIIVLTPKAITGSEDWRQYRNTTKETSATSGPLITDTTIPQPTGTVTLFVPVYYAFSSRNFDSRWHSVSAPARSASTTIPAQIFYGLAERWETYLTVPYKYNRVWGSNAPGPGGERSAEYGGLGDISIAFKYLLSNERPEFPAVSVLINTGFPTGRHGSLNPRLLGTDSLGTGAYSFTSGLNLYKVVAPATLYANLWYTTSTDATVNGKKKYYRDVITFNAAAEIPITGKWIFLSEFASTWGEERLFGQRSNQPRLVLASILPGLEFIANNTWNFDAAVKIDIFGKNTGHGYAPVIAVFYNF